MELLVFFIITYILLCISLYLLFPKAEKEAWKGLVPFYHFIPWCRIIGRKPTHALLLLIPIVNIFIFFGMAVDMMRSFGQYRFLDSALAVIYTPAAFFKLALNKNISYLGPNYPKETAYQEKVKELKKAKKERELKRLVNNNPYYKSPLREWMESIVFAVFAAAFIRMFLIEAYTIPTSSMEGSLLVGDYLFVSKAHYGIRIPMTVLQVPLLHNRVPMLNTESYMTWPSLPYIRLPKLMSIDHNDPVVFNWPVGDSVWVTPTRSWSYEQVKNLPPGQRPPESEIIVRPKDKTDFYIKRAIGLPGDSLKIIDKQVHINGNPAQNPTELQFKYYVINTQGALNRDALERIGVSLYDMAGQDIYFLTEDQAEKIRNWGEEFMVKPVPGSNKGLFPNHPVYFLEWNNDNYGPIYIPEKGTTISLTSQNLALYRRVIDVYEDNDLQIKNGEAIINGERADTYRFKQDYYWMMGDNRHNSEDSRVWGFVPEDHIVGKPLFIFFSTEGGAISNGIRWDRLFTSATKM